MRKGRTSEDYDLTTTPMFFVLFTDEANISNQFMKWLSESQNAECASIVSMMADKTASRHPPVNFSTLLASTNSALLELGMKKIAQVNTLAHAMRKYLKKDPLLDFLFCAVLESNLKD